MNDPYELFPFTNLLTFTIALPLIGAGLVTALRGQGQNTARWTALIFSLVTFFLAVRLVLEPGTVLYEHDWFVTPRVDIRLDVGLDGLGLWLFALSALLTVTGVLVSWDEIHDRPAAFYGLLLMLESGLLGVFTARDIILFYVFFEFTLIPLFFLIGIWGHEDRRWAAIKFFLYTLTGSLLAFLGLLAIVVWSYQHTGKLQFSVEALASAVTTYHMPQSVQVAIFLALFAGFAIKVPLFPFHTWLPLAHVQAPTAGSVDLAGILLKIGTYGFLRFSMPMLPEATVLCMPWLLLLAVIGIVYGAVVALAQSDMKKLIAYSSVSHMGFCILGLFALNDLGVKGGALQMLNHGIVTGGLFALIGMIYERYHTREIRQLGGLAKRMPILSVFMIIFTFAAIGLPGTNGFVGEFLILLGMFQRAWSDAPPQFALQWQVISVVAVFGVVLGAWYMLWMVERVFFGPLKEPPHKHDAPPIRDLSPREIFALAPLVVLVFWIGLFPQYFLQRMEPDLSNIAKIYNENWTDLMEVHTAAAPAKPQSPPAKTIESEPTGERAIPTEAPQEGAVRVN